jgi:hypothetical protein
MIPLTRKKGLELHRSRSYKTTKIKHTSKLSRTISPKSKTKHRGTSSGVNPLHHQEHNIFSHPVSHSTQQLSSNTSLTIELNQSSQVLQMSHDDEGDLFSYVPFHNKTKRKKITRQRQKQKPPLKPQQPNLISKYFTPGKITAQEKKKTTN